VHSCGLSGRNQIYCWGTSTYGELGSSSSLATCGGVGQLCSATPVLATSTTAIGITAGDMFTCALDESGAAYCWGGNFYGQLGVGGGATAPTSVLQPVTGGHQFTQLAAGRFHACGITTSGDAYCWGWDDTGQLGAGDVSSERCTFFSLDPCSTTPRLVVGGHKWGLLAASEHATCGIALTGVAYCWGFAVGGSDGLYCGEAESLSGCARTPIQVGTDHLFRDISIGDVHRCEQAADNTLECWGGDYFGAFGDGTEEFSATPVPAAGGAAYSWLVSSHVGMCGLANSGHAQCWGSDQYGQVGNGFFRSAQLTPDDVAGNYVFDALASSGSSSHVCGITRDGRALCWGRGEFGELGNGAMLNQNTPQFVHLIPLSPSEAIEPSR
jgi:alpha-tubulin suppressor-like RCC1 family protein